MPHGFVIVRRVGQAIVTAALLACSPLVGQQGYAPGEIRLSSRPYSPSQSVLQVRSHEVQVNVVVRDSHSHPIGGLKAADFEIFDEGRRQTITGFLIENSQVSSENNVGASSGAGGSAASEMHARYIVLFLDDINTEQADLSRAASAARKFVSDGMGSHDYVSIYAASGSQVVDFTVDKRVLLDSLSSVRLHARYTFRGEKPCYISGYEAYLVSQLNDSDEITHLAKCIAQHFMVPADNTPYSPAANLARADADKVWGNLRVAILDTFASLRSALQTLSLRRGSRILLMASSGFISGPLDREKDQIEADALRARIVINALDAKGLYAELLGPPIDDPNAEDSPDQLIRQVESLGARLQTTNAVMDELSQATGGRFIQNNNDLIGGIRSLVGVPQLSYMLSFDPSLESSDGRFHKLKVRLISGRHDIQARPGYFAPTKEQAARQTPEQKLHHEVSSSDRAAEISAIITTQLLKTSKNSSKVSVTFHVDLNSLEFQKQKDREVQQLKFVAALFDERGNFVTGKEGEMDLALKQESFTRLEASGISGSLELEVLPGSYVLRAVAQEAVNGKFAASSQPIQIH